jgi:methylenetetrahydrofolate/methylenetetrahydromethanopterin dehydrogenase (NADP+)
MTKARILLQLDVDAQPSVFDSVVAIDAPVAHLLRHGNINQDNVVGLVHGTIFTRGIEDLKSTAIFIGGSDVEKADHVMKAVKKSFFGPMRVSVMLDANGANTTAAAAVLASARHTNLSNVHAVVLGGTGPVGQRIARLLAARAKSVTIFSRDEWRAATVCDSLRAQFPQSDLRAAAYSLEGDAPAELASANVIYSAGAAGIELLSETRLKQLSAKIVVDLNAVPPVGIFGVDSRDKAVERNGRICYGALGVGGTKMKIHKAAIDRLFESNNHSLDAEQIFELGIELGLGT